MTQSRLLPETASLLQEAESLSGTPIALGADAGIREGTRATLRLARPGWEAHLLLYNPAYERDLDHLVAHECGHALRFYATSEENRLVPVSNRESQQKALKQIEHELAPLMRKGVFVPAMAELVQALHDGVVLQLVNTPADLRIEQWLYDTQPALRESQRRSLTGQARSYRAALRRDIERLTPPTIYRASTTLNYAFCRLAAEICDDPSLVRPYAKSRHRELGEMLYQSIVYTADSGHQGDCALVDEWSRWLGLEGWFRWSKLDRLQTGPDSLNTTPGRGEPKGGETRTDVQNNNR